MMPIQIVVNGEKLSVSSQQGYRDYLKVEGVKFLRDSEGTGIVDFGSLVPGRTYTLGPAMAAVSVNL